MPRSAWPRRSRPPFEGKAVKIASIARAEPFATKDGSTIRELHHTEQQSLAEATLEPDQATERHYHRLTEEIYFVVKGSGRLEVDGETQSVRPGDAVLIPPGAWHTLENNGTSELRILCCCSPAYSHEDTYFE
jgi:mannose-6-phosphate isomerase-like protein (cupin superfamily)